MSAILKVGDLVTTDDAHGGQVGVVVELTDRFYTPALYIPTAKVFIEGEVAEFDVEELWRFHEDR